MQIHTGLQFHNRRESPLRRGNRATGQGPVLSGRPPSAPAGTAVPPLQPHQGDAQSTRGPGLGGPSPASRASLAPGCPRPFPGCPRGPATRHPLGIASGCRDLTWQHCDQQGFSPRADRTGAAGIPAVPAARPHARGLPLSVGGGGSRGAGLTHLPTGCWERVSKSRRCPLLLPPEAP